MKISELLKTYRKTNSLTQSDIARQLFVSKQAVSRWENDLSLPDITMYPKLSEMLGVSVDELMGKEKTEEKEKPKQVNYKKIIITVILYLLLIIEIIMFVLIQNAKKTNLSQEEKNLKLASTTLDMEFSEVTLYEEVDFSTWKKFNDINYPVKMYHFIFRDEIKTVSKKLTRNLSDNIIVTAPNFISNYFDSCDYFFYIHDEKTNLCTLYCLQINNKRLIVFNYYKEVPNEKNN